MVNFRDYSKKTHGYVAATGRFLHKYHTFAAKFKTKNLLRCLGH